MAEELFPYGYSTIGAFTLVPWDDVGEALAPRELRHSVKSADFVWKFAIRKGRLIAAQRMVKSDPHTGDAIELRKLSYDLAAVQAPTILDELERPA